MSTAPPAPSLEPYLRARALNPTLIPSNQPRTAGWNSLAQPKSNPNDDFVEFLRRLVKVLLSPVTVPVRWTYQALTSPLTISLVLRLILLGFLTLASAVFSFLAVGAWWYSWGAGGPVEVEGWLFYGSTGHRTPHAFIPLSLDQFQEDLRYDVQVEMELVRPSRGSEEMGNFMLSLQLRSARDQNVVVVGAAQPSLPPPPLPSTLLALPSFPTYLLPPCILPWPLRSFCPSRVLGYDGWPDSKIRERRARGGFASPVKGKDVVLLRKELMEGVIVNPGRGGDATVGTAFVSIGRDDSFTGTTESGQCNVQPREVRTTGWVVVRFVPRPTGIRWLLSVHPLPPLILLPPLSLSLTLSSSLFAFLVITYLIRPRDKPPADKGKSKLSASDRPMSDEALFEEKRSRVFDARDKEEKRESSRRRREWEEVESSALGGLKQMPENRKRESTLIGGSETTAPTAISSFAPIPESDDGTDDTVTETATESGVLERESASSEGWEEETE